LNLITISHCFLNRRNPGHQSINPGSPTALLAAIIIALFSNVGTVAAQESRNLTTGVQQAVRVGEPKEIALKKAGSTELDLRDITRQKPRMRIRPERTPPPLSPIELPGGAVPDANQLPSAVPALSAPAPSPIDNFAGLDLATWGAGWPPDTVGDVGPTHYIQSVNNSVGIYVKSTGTRVAAFTLNTFFALGSYGNLCDTDNFGDPVILYDSFEDRWVISDFAFQLADDNVVNPPGAFECIAVSKTGDPVSGGWNFYFLNVTDGLNDYPKLGIWPDGIYMAANMFDFDSTGGYQLSRVWVLNKKQMYAGESNIQVVEFDAPPAEFTLLPANARLQAGTPPTGTPNYFSTIWQYTNAISFYKFHVDWDSISLSTFTGPFISIAPSNWDAPPSTVAVKDGANIDTLLIRLMMQNQYSNIDGVESLWNSHTVLGDAAGTAAPRYYQVDVTGDVVSASTTQATTHAPDITINRIMPSLAVNRHGDMAIGYSAVSSTLFPAIRYAGRLSSDTVNTLPQTETSLIEGTGSQTIVSRWGDYSAMSLDPDGCTFWYTNEYYAVTGTDWQTRIGSFMLPDCTAVSSGTVEGTITATTGGAAIGGATVSLGSRTTTTDGNGFYQFTSIPSGTYPILDVAAPGFDPKSFNTVLVSDGGTTIRDFSLDNALASACPIDTSQTDFQFGVPLDVDLTSSAGDVILNNSVGIDQENNSVTNDGFGIDTTFWAGQTFTAGVTGEITAADAFLFCSGCVGTTPDLTISIRATSGDVPTGPDLATGTIAGFSTGAGGYFGATFTTPLSITSGTTYAIVIRANSNPSAGTYAYVHSFGSDPYPGGRRVTSSDSGSSWFGQTTDLGFHVFVTSGYVSSGTLISSLIDSNPATGAIPEWLTLSWTGSEPTNTGLSFQAAGSNSASGPFNFVGPGGTDASFYTSSGGSLSQFDGNRYLKYRAHLSTTDASVTPTLSDVTACYNTSGVTACNINMVSGVTETSEATHEACEFLTLGPDFTVEDGASVILSSGLEIWFMPGFSVQTGASMSAAVCGQSLCETSPSPMPEGCHSCVVEICDVDPLCCSTAFDASCLVKVDTVCGLVCE
jgi:hypothetical protein